MQALVQLHPILKKGIDVKLKELFFTNSGIQNFFCLRIADDDGSSEQTYQIVGDQEADVKSGLVSISSPIARALIGKEVGDAIEVNAPGGARAYEIVKVNYV